MEQMKDEASRRIADLVERVCAIPDAESRRIAQELMEAILEWHGAGLERALEILHASGDVGDASIRRLASDGLVSSLLVLHDLHPDDFETRVLHAINKLGITAESVNVFGNTIRIRVTGGGCGGPQSIDAALRAAVPDASEVIVEEIARMESFVPIAALRPAV